MSRSPVEIKSERAQDRSEVLESIAEQCGTPTYVYFREVIEHQCQALLQFLAPYRHRLFYAMKANANRKVVRTILGQGVGIEAVSIGEIEYAVRLGANPREILFSPNNLGDGEVHAAQSRGVIFNIGSLSRLERFGRKYPGQDVCVRINPAIGAGHHKHVVTAGKLTKFGIGISEIPEILSISKTNGLRVVGLHQHIGSGIEGPDAFSRAATVLAEVSPAFEDLRFINFGGGINVPYAPGDKDFDLAGLATNFERVADILSAGREQMPEIWMEPGRFLVAEAGLLLARANTLKTADDRTFVGIDSGFNHLVRPSMYEAYHHILNLSNPLGDATRYDVTGNICESGDLFARDRDIPEVREGDLLGIMDAGAYGMTMASHYNMRALPAEVMLDADDRWEIVRERTTLEQLLQPFLR